VLHSLKSPDPGRRRMGVALCLGSGGALGGRGGDSFLQAARVLRCQRGCLVCRWSNRQKYCLGRAHSGEGKRIFKHPGLQNGS